MSIKNFIENKKALIVLIAASMVVLISMGIRQCWGLFYQYFETDLGFSRTQFGLAIAIQMLFWGAFAPVFGFFADKYGGAKAVFIAFLVYIIGIYLVYIEPKSVFSFQLGLGLMIGIALGGTAMSVPVSCVGKFFS